MIKEYVMYSSQTQTYVTLRHRQILIINSIRISHRHILTFSVVKFNLL
jgi:hypothetical protein